MSVTTIGQLSLGELLPAAAALKLALDANIGLTMPNIQSQILGLQLSLSLPIPSIALSLQLANELVASIQAAITIGVPDIDFSILMINDLLARLLALLGQLEAQLAFSAELGLLFSTAGVHAYAYDGPTSQLGTELQSKLSGGLPGGSGSEQAYGLLLVTTTPAAWSAMQALFKTTP